MRSLQLWLTMSGLLAAVLPLADAGPEPHLYNYNFFPVAGGGPSPYHSPYYAPYYAPPAPPPHPSFYYSSNMPDTYRAPPPPPPPAPYQQQQQQQPPSYPPPSPLPPSPLLPPFTLFSSPPPSQSASAAQGGEGTEGAWASEWYGDTVEEEGEEETDAVTGGGGVKVQVVRLAVEAPTWVSPRFSGSVPVVAVSEERLRLLDDVLVLRASPHRPALTVKTRRDRLVSCTPAARIQLDPPLVLRSPAHAVPFPRHVQIQLGGRRLLLEVGALLAPLHSGARPSPDAPVTVSVLYAVPSRPPTLLQPTPPPVAAAPPPVAPPTPDDTQAVVVESDASPQQQPPKNVTVLEFPEAEAEPILQVDEEDDELVNRNPPQVLAPAGIAQSTQPQSSVQPFHNSKESPVLTALKEEASQRLRRRRDLAPRSSLPH